MTRPAARLAETLRTILESQAVDLHTSMPGIVKSYDAATQTADIQPAIQRVIPAIDDDNEDQTETLPVLPSVPIIWPRSGGFFLHFPIAEGDTVLLVFCEQDTNAWRNDGGVVDPGLPERHGLSGAVAYAGYSPRANANGSASGEFGRVGSEGGAFVEFRPSEIRVGGANALAEAAGVQALYNAIANAAVSTGAPDSGAAFKAAILLALETDPDWANMATTITQGD